MEKINYIIENIVDKEVQKHLNEVKTIDTFKNLYIKVMEQVQELFPNNKELSGGYMFMDKYGHYFNISEPIIKSDYISIYTLFDLENQDDSEENGFFIDEIQDYKKFINSLKSDAKRVIIFNEKILNIINEINSSKNKFKSSYKSIEAFLDSDGNDYEIENLDFKNGCLNYTQIYTGYKEERYDESENNISEVKDILNKFKRDFKRRLKWLSLDPDTIDKMDDSGDYSSLNNEEN